MLNFSMRIFGLLILILSFPALAKKKQKKEPEPEGLLKDSTFAGLKVRSLGPAFMSGRIADIAIDPKNPSIRYLAVGSGGVWKTINAGVTWQSIFDGQGSYSIGCISIDPNNSNVIWVGSGENVGGRHVAYGDGIYRSDDGGQSWQNMGLKDSEHIGSISIDPRDSNVILVAAQGPLWSKGGERGLFKTTDGGTTWKNVLNGGPYTGVNEVVRTPGHPHILYASTHQKHRTVAGLVNGGPETSIYKSVDGGDTWVKSEKGLPPGDKGKIGLAVSFQDPTIVYATVELPGRKGGFFRSSDSGASWKKMSDYVSGGTGPHYYQEIFASPHHFDHIYHMDVQLHVSRDGGKTFTRVPGAFKHSDNHALAFHPDDPNYLLSGCDGGLYESYDLGENWRYYPNLPITQFYKVAVDYDQPFYNVYGGTQDNATQGGPSRTDNHHGIRSSDWFITVFGDGHQPAVDPTNPDIVYSEWQEGNLVRHDRRTGEIIHIQPQPGKGEPGERFNWDSPIVISPHNPERLYFASQRVWRSDDRGNNWTAISGDLSHGRDRFLQPHMDRVQSINATWDIMAMSTYGNITSLSESPKVAGLLYAGTDDGRIQVTENGGETWRAIEVGSLPGVPKNAFVNDIKADLHDENTVYVVLDDHKNGNYNPFILKSSDRGKQWTSIAGNLPERQLLWRVVQDHEKPELLFLGAEFGVYFSVDSGKKWIKLTGGMPTISIRDLAIQKRENDLVAASFGRGLFVLDDYTALRHVSEKAFEQAGLIFPIRDAWWYMPKKPMGFGTKGYQGDSYYTAKNPEFGAMVTYYVKEELTTLKAKRMKSEKELAKDGKDTPRPSWDALKAENMEQKPAIYFVVRNEAGDVIRRLEGKNKAGIHRINWDLTYDDLDAWVPPRPRPSWDPTGGRGRFAAPGNYNITMVQLVDGVSTQIGSPQSFVVKPLREPTLKNMTPEEAVAFNQRIDKINGSMTAVGQVMDNLGTRLGAIKDVLKRSRMDVSELYAKAVSLEKQHYELNDLIFGHTVMGEHFATAPPSISSRIGNTSFGTAFTTTGPSGTHLKQLEIALEEYTDAKKAVDKLAEDLNLLEAALDKAGAPWTPGRAIPKIDQ